MLARLDLALCPLDGAYSSFGKLSLLLASVAPFSWSSYFPDSSCSVSCLFFHQVFKHRFPPRLCPWPSLFPCASYWMISSVSMASTITSVAGSHRYVTNSETSAPCLTIMASSPVCLLSTLNAWVLLQNRCQSSSSLQGPCISISVSKPESVEVTWHWVLLHLPPLIHHRILRILHSAFSLPYCNTFSFTLLLQLLVSPTHSPYAGQSCLIYPDPIWQLTCLKALDGSLLSVGENATS